MRSGETMMGIIRKLMVLGPHGVAAIGRSRQSRQGSLGPAAVHHMGKSRQNVAAIGRSQWSRHSSLGPAAVHRMGKSRQNGLGLVAGHWHWRSRCLQSASGDRGVKGHPTRGIQCHCQALQRISVCCNFGVYLNFKSKLSTHDENYSMPVSSFLIEPVLNSPVEFKLHIGYILNLSIIVTIKCIQVHTKTAKKINTYICLERVTKPFLRFLDSIKQCKPLLLNGKDVTGAPHLKSFKTSQKTFKRTTGISSTSWSGFIIEQ